MCPLQQVVLLLLLLMLMLLLSWWWWWWWQCVCCCCPAAKPERDAWKCGELWLHNASVAHTQPPCLCWVVCGVSLLMFKEGTTVATINNLQPPTHTPTPHHPHPPC